MAKKKKKQNKPEVNAEIKPMILVALGILFGIIIYTAVPGPGSILKELLLGGLMGRLTFALPFLLVFMGIYSIFKDYSRLRLKPFLFILLFICIASLITAFDFDIKFTELENENFFSQIATLCGSGTQYAQEANMGGGLIGALLTVPIRAALGSLFVKVFFILAIIILSLLITGIAFSSIVIGIRDFFSDSTDKVKELASRHKQREEEEYEEEEEEEIPIPAIPVKTKSSAKSKITNQKFKKIMEQTEIVEPGKQITISDLDLEQYEDEHPDEEIEEEPEETIEEVEEVEEKPEKTKSRVLVPIENKKATPKEIPKPERKA